MKKIVRGVALSVLSAIVVFNSAFSLTGYAADEVDASLSESSLIDEDNEILLEDPIENEDISENSSEELLEEDITENILEEIPNDVSENSSEFCEETEDISTDALATSGKCGDTPPGPMMQLQRLLP
jgi:hypothetical protein